MMEEILDLIESLALVNESNFLEKMSSINKTMERIRDILKKELDTRTLTKEQVEFIEVRFKATTSYIVLLYDKVINNNN